MSQPESEELDLASRTPDAVAAAITDIRDEAWRVAHDAEADGDDRLAVLARVVVKLADHVVVVDAASGPSPLSDDRSAAEEDERLTPPGVATDEG